MGRSGKGKRGSRRRTIIDKLRKLADNVIKDDRLKRAMRRLRDAERRAAEELLEIYQQAQSKGIDAKTARRINRLRRRIGLKEDFMPDTIYLLERSGRRIMPDGSLMPRQRGWTRLRLAADIAAISAMLALGLALPAADATDEPPRRTPAQQRQEIIRQLTTAHDILYAQLKAEQDPDKRREMREAIAHISRTILEIKDIDKTAAHIRRAVRE